MTMGRHKDTGRYKCFVCWKEAKEVKRTPHTYFVSFEAIHTNGTVHRWTMLSKMPA